MHWFEVKGTRFGVGIGAGAGNGLCVKIREAEELYEGKEPN